ncbi:MAG: hypothetical protein HQL23_03080 [Candidatus Omnitrophica bacterium]|nr:hypothetical protein [Candidatus Omnitrophota bacterium]
MPRQNKILSLVLCLCLIYQQTGFAQIAGSLNIPGAIGAFRNSLIQEPFRPLHLRSLSYDPAGNNFHLLIDKGDFKTPQSADIEAAAKILLNYFFVGITLPNSAFWVNLKPDAPDRIMDSRLAKTDVGKVLLAADVQLKKDTAKFTSPDMPEGKQYWEKLYQKAAELYGTQNIEIPTMTRPWIVPGEIIISEGKKGRNESGNGAYIYKATLKVMLEQDYLKDSAVYNFKDPRAKALNEYAARLVRELIIPKLTVEINAAPRYAALRQVYYSLIMAQWFKSRYKGRPGVYSALIDKENLAGLASPAAWSPLTYFAEYKKSFQSGEYNTNQAIDASDEPVVRNYISGGMVFDLSIPAASLSAASSGAVTVYPSFVAPPITPTNMPILATFSSPLRAAEIRLQSSSPLGNLERKRMVVSSSPVETLQFNIGDQVMHIKYGKGRVESVQTQTAHQTDPLTGRTQEVSFPAYTILFPAPIGKRTIGNLPNMPPVLSAALAERPEELSAVKQEDVSGFLDTLLAEALLPLEAAMPKDPTKTLRGRIDENLAALRQQLSQIQQASGNLYDKGKERLQKLRMAAPLFFIAAMYNMGDILQLMEMDAAGRFMMRDADFDRFIARLKKNYSLLSPAEILSGLTDYHMEKHYSILWLLIKRGNIKDWVWENAAEDIARLGSQGKRLLKLLNIQDASEVSGTLQTAAQVARQKDEKKGQPKAQQALSDRLFFATGHTLAEFTAQPALIDVYADEIAEVLNPPDKSGITFRISPRDLTELKYGDLCGDCTASLNAEKTGVGINFWSVPIWIASQMHFMVTQYRGGKFYAKYNMIIVKDRAGNLTLYVHAVEVAAKTSTQASVFQDRQIRVEMLNSGLKTINKMAANAGISTVYYTTTSNTDWVSKTITALTEPAPVVRLSKIGKFFSSRSADIPADFDPLSPMYVQGFEDIDARFATIAGLRQLRKPRDVKALQELLVRHSREEISTGVLNILKSVLEQDISSFDTTDPVKIAQLYSALIDDAKFHASEVMAEAIVQPGIENIPAILSNAIAIEICLQYSWDVWNKIVDKEDAKELTQEAVARLIDEAGLPEESARQTIADIHAFMGGGYGALLDFAEGKTTPQEVRAILIKDPNPLVNPDTQIDTILTEMKRSGVDFAYGTMSSAIVQAGLPAVAAPVINDGSADSTATPTMQDNKTGGVDFKDLRGRPANSLLNGQGGALSPAEAMRLEKINLTAEWQRIQAIVNEGVLPSSERVKNFLLACCQQEVLADRMGYVMGLIAEILRIEESRAFAAEPAISDMVSLLLSGKPDNEILSGIMHIKIQPQELQLIIP